MAARRTCRRRRCRASTPRTGFALHREWERKLSEGRWSAVSWPEEYGGRGVDYIQWLIFEEEYYRAGAPGRVNQNGIFLLGPTIMEFGTPEQKARFLPTMASSEIVWAQALVRAQRRLRHGGAALHRRAATTTAPYVLNGQKIWARAPSSPTGASGSSAPIPSRSATAGSRSSSCRSTRPASPCARSRSSTATPASRRSSSTTCACRSRTRSAR